MYRIISLFLLIVSITFCLKALDNPPDSTGVSNDSSGTTQSSEHKFEYSKVNLETLYTPPFVGDSTRSTARTYTLDKEPLQILRPDSLNTTLEYGGKGSLAGVPQKIYFDRGFLTILCDTVKGQQVGIVSEEGDTLKFVYDGTIIKKVTWSGLNGLNSVKGSVAFSYNNDFQVSTETVIPSNGSADSVNLKYDLDGLLKSVGAMKLRYSTVNTLMLGDTVGNIITNYTYDGFGAVASKEVMIGATILFRTDYVRDSLGKITEKRELIDGRLEKFNYTYNSVGRLVQVKKNDTLTTDYKYDYHGNRLSKITSSDTTRGIYDAQDRLLTYSNTSYSYTNNGDLQFKVEGSDTTHYSYDAFGNLRNVRLPNGTLIGYLIDGSCHRVGRKVNGIVTNKWIYSSDFRIIAELDSTNKVTSRFVYATSDNVPEYFIKSDTVYRIITDNIGSVRQVVNVQTGIIVQQIDYDEYGNVLFDSNPNCTPFGYAGGLYDPQTKLVKFGARDYDASIGRWTVKDRIGFKGGTNLFAYCSLDPINSNDVSGDDAKGAFVEIIQAIISLAAMDVGSAGVHASAAFIQALTASEGTHFDRWGNLAKNSDNTKLVDKRGFDLVRGFTEGFASGIIIEGAEMPQNSKPVNKSGALYLLGYTIGSWLGRLAAP